MNTESAVAYYRQETARFRLMAPKVLDYRLRRTMLGIVKGATAAQTTSLKSRLTSCGHPGRSRAGQGTRPRQHRTHQSGILEQPLGENSSDIWRRRLRRTWGSGTIACAGCSPRWGL